MITRNFIVIVLIFIWLACADNNYNERIEYNKENIENSNSMQYRLEKQVLDSQNIGIEYSFQHSEAPILYTITYLGNINSKVGMIHFLNIVSISGQSHRGNGSFALYNSSLHRLGQYYVGGVSDVPSRIEKDNLIFEYNDTRCNQNTSINFSDSIPRQIFIACTKDGGDLYPFEQTK